MDMDAIKYIDDEDYQKNIEIIKKLSLMDDDFMTLFFDGNTECTELVIRVILERDDIDVIQVVSQREYKGTREHSIRLDVLAKDKEGRLYDIEIQRADKYAGAKRARYYSGMLDRGILKKGEDYDKLVDTYVIFITENDIYGAGLPLYHVERQIKELGKDFGDGAHIIYVNGKYRGEDPVGRLMHDFMCYEADDMYNDVLANRLGYFKNSEKGHGSMSKIIDDRVNELADKKVKLMMAEIRKEATKELEKEIYERVEKETAERVEKETAERVEKETAERVEKETAERVEKETAERVEKETAEKAEKEKKRNIRDLLKAGKITIDDAIKFFTLSPETEKELKAEFAV